MKATAESLSRPALEPAQVLTRALLRAASLLGVRHAALARIVGVSPATMSRIAARGRTIEPSSKEGELALLFLRLFRSLDTVFGGNAEQCREWFAAFNHHLGDEPARLVQSPLGLVHVVDYLDALRGQG